MHVQNEMATRRRPLLHIDLLYPGQELNLHSHCWEKDFKSFASTDSATGVFTFTNESKQKIPFNIFSRMELI